MPGLPAPSLHRFGGLDTVVDDVHALFDGWAETDAFADVLDDYGLHVVRLAVHEWIANLVQHADFGGRRPEIALTVEAEPGGLRCLIEDNSDGFDFHRQVERQGAVVGAPEPSERGRGLLMLIACTADLHYEPTASGPQRLAFSVRPPVPPEALVPLFPGSDLADPHLDAADLAADDADFAGFTAADDESAGAAGRAS